MKKWLLGMVLCLCGSVSQSLPSLDINVKEKPYFTVESAQVEILKKSQDAVELCVSLPVITYFYDKPVRGSRGISENALLAAWQAYRQEVGLAIYPHVMIEMTLPKESTSHVALMRMNDIVKQSNKMCFALMSEEAIKMDIQDFRVDAIDRDIHKKMNQVVLKFFLSSKGMSYLTGRNG